MVVGQLSTKADVAVIGGGPGGYTAAIRAAQLGLEVILIEKDKLGGTCTNAGCIPTKALIHAAKLKRTMSAQNTREMGLDTTVAVDFARMQQWKDSVVKNMRDGIGTLCRLNGVEFVKGRAAFISSHKLSVETESGLRDIEFGKAIIATGTTIKGLNNLPYDHSRIIDSDDALKLNDIPKAMIIVGGGYIAVEMACMFMNLGSDVTIVYRGERLLKGLDAEMSDLLAKNIHAKGGKIIFGGEVESVSGNDAIVRTPDGTKTIRFDKMLVAVGRGTDFTGLGLEKTKVKLDLDGRIIVDPTRRTTDDNIYAVGDVTPGPQLAHKAFREGKVAAEAIAGQKSAFDNIAIPMVVFSDPVMASVGMSEEEANKLGYRIKIGKMPFSTSGKARILDETEGFVKIVADEGGTLLGMQIIGPEAETLIAEAALALEMGATVEDLADTIHAHPTLPETLAEAAEDALGNAVHLYKGKKFS